MAEKHIHDSPESSETVQVLVTNIFWCKRPAKLYAPKRYYYEDEIDKLLDELPVQATLDLPKHVLAAFPEAVSAGKFSQDAKDTIETYVYNTLSYKHSIEVSRCQIWLPLP